MRLESVQVSTFGALHDLSLALCPGVNVVVGPNEAGKSTLFSAIRHVLLTPSRLTKPQFSRLLSRHLPRPHGTVLEAAVTLVADETFILRRRWGDEPRSEIITADGARITGGEVDERLAAAFPVKPGTYASVFLIDQAQIDATLRLLQASHESRDEITAALRATREETGGVPLEAFRRVLASRLRASFAHWDRERDRPEGGRGPDNRWQREVGLVLKTYYDLQTAKRELTETRRAERELDEANAELESRGGAFRGVADFVSRNREAYEALRQIDSLDRRIDDLERALGEIRSAIRRWPVVVDELTRRAADAESAIRDVARLEGDLAEAADRRARAERRALSERAVKAAAEVDAARDRVKAIAPVSADGLAALREAEAKTADLRARLTAGSLRGRVGATAAADVTVRVDGGADRSVTLENGSSVEVDAHRQVVVTAGEVTVTVEAGDEPFDELSARCEAAELELRAVADGLGVRTAEEAVVRRGERAAAERELAAAERRLAEVLGDESLEALRAELAEAPQALEPTEDESTIARELADAQGRRGEAVAAKRALEHEAGALADRYGSQDSLEDALAETKGRLTTLREQREAVAEVPDGFETIASFLDAYRAQEAQLDALRAAHHEARIRQAEYLGRLPERTGEELAEVVADAEREYARARRRADALTRLEAAVAETLAEDEADPYAPYADRVAAYLSVASADRYAAEPDGDSLLPGRYRRVDGPTLDYPLLSQGTRDMVALAIRLALAEVAAPESEAPLLLDDPLVDMDPVRRSRAARAIMRYGERHQVVLFTCHPDHAALFADAHRVELEPAEET